MSIEIRALNCDFSISSPSGGTSSATPEAFAETFMLFVKHKGKIPAKFARLPAIRRKWQAVATIVKAVAAAAR